MRRRLAVAAAALGLLAACGGGGGASSGEQAVNPPAARPILRYTNPPATGFRLEVEPSSNRTSRLLLHLKGPEGLPVRGVACFIQLGPEPLAWVAPGPGSGLVRNGGTWGLAPGQPRLEWARAAQGTLQLGIFQREAQPVRLGSAPLASLALTAGPGAPKGPALLAHPANRHSVYLDGDRNLLPLVVAIGTLTVE